MRWRKNSKKRSRGIPNPNPNNVPFRAARACCEIHHLTLFVLFRVEVTEKFKHMTKAFRHYDKDQSNTLDKEEMRGLLQAPSPVHR